MTYVSYTDVIIMMCIYSSIQKSMLRSSSESGKSSAQVGFKDSNYILFCLNYLLCIIWSSSSSHSWCAALYFSISSIYYFSFFFIECCNYENWSIAPVSWSSLMGLFEISSFNFFADILSLLLCRSSARVEHYDIPKSYSSF